MKKKQTKLILYSISGLMLLTTGYRIKRCREKSINYTKSVQEYIENFSDDDFLIAAHRGFSSLAIENTKEAISLADKSLYIDYIEIDARLTKDNQLVLSHDDLILTKSQQMIRISETNYKDLNEKDPYYLSNSLSVKIQNAFNTENGDILINRAQDLNSKTYKLSTLKEGLDECKNKKVLLDLKFDNNTKSFVKSLEKDLKNTDVNNIIFQSSDLLSLLYLQNKHPEYTCLAIIDNKSDLDYAPLFNNLGIRKHLVNEKIVKKFVEEGKTIAVWTVNNPEEINNIINNLGREYKDVIYISNYPDIVAKCLNDKEQKEKKLSKKKTTP